MKREIVCLFSYLYLAISTNLFEIFQQDFKGLFVPLAVFFFAAAQTWCRVSEVGNVSSLSSRSHHISVCLLHLSPDAKNNCSDTVTAFDQSLQSWARLKADYQQCYHDNDRSGVTFQRFRNSVQPAERDALIEAITKVGTGHANKPSVVAWQQKEIVSLDDVVHCVKSAVRPLECGNCTGGQYACTWCEIVSLVIVRVKVEVEVTDVLFVWLDGLGVTVNDAKSNSDVNVKKNSEHVTSTAVEEVGTVIIIYSNLSVVYT